MVPYSLLHGSAVTALCPPSPPGACAGSREAEQHTRAGLHHASRAWSLLASAHAAAAGPRTRTRGSGVWAAVSLASSLAARNARVTRGRAMSVGRDGAPRHRARCIAHTHARKQPRTRGQARAARGWGWLAGRVGRCGLRTRRRAARERRARVAAELGASVQRGAPRCTCERRADFSSGARRLP